MPTMSLLPLGTVIDGKASSPGWEQLRFMVTGYFPVVKDTGVHFDYTVTPWPLGYVNIDDGTQKMFYGCNEEAIGSIDFLGAVDECAKENVDWVYAEARRREDVKTPLAQGAEPMMHSYGDLPCTIGDMPFSGDDVLPLGTVVSTARNGARKGMIYQHGGTYHGEHYDYGVCAWPEGADPGLKEVQLIKHDEITAVHFRGYENKLSLELAKRLGKKRHGSLFSRLLGWMR